MAKKDKTANHARPGRRSLREGLWRGVGTRLLLVFLGVTMMTVLVAVVGYRGLADSRRTLEGAQESFGRVSELLGEATSSLGSASSTIEAAGATLDSTIATVSDTSERVNRLNTIDIPAVVAIGAIRQSLTAVAVGERTLLMRQLYDPRIRGQMRTAISTAFARSDSAIAGISGISPRLDEKTRTAWRSFLDSWREWISIHESLMDEFDAIDDLLGQRLRGGFEFEEISKAAFDIAFGEGLAARETVDQRLDAVVSLIRESAREGGLAASKEAASAAAEAITAKDSMQFATRQLRAFQDSMVTVNDRVGETTGEMAASIANTRRVRIFFIVCAAAGLVVSVLVALRQTRRLARPIRAAARQMDLLAKGEIDHNILSVYESRPDEIGALARSVGEMLDSLREEVSIAGEMAEGDFSGRVRLRGEKDKLGRALSAMMRITHDALTRVNRHVRQVTGGAESISRVSGALSTGATRTAEALVEISATMTQLGEQTHRNAENAMQANEFAIASQRVAERGYEAVEEMVSSMQDIQASGAQIARIVKLIDDIAFQTNLLALNAAVEAARAGRQGKGFSVVAGEVRNLASRSAKAARETAVLVEETVKRVENGVAIAGRTDGAFKEILANAERTTDLYGKIALASQEQSSGIDQVVQGVGRIDDLTQENSRYAVETADSARELSRQSGELRQMMVRFQLQEEGAAGAGGGDAAAEISLEGEAARRMITLSGRPEARGAEPETGLVWTPGR